MRVIHGIWAHGSLCLWAEDPDLPPVPGSAPRGARLLPPHPFACQAAELADTLAGWPGPAGDAARKAVHDELTLRLPTAGGRPLASPEPVMPPACRAVAGEAPGPLLAGVLDSLADTAARAALPASLLPARRGRLPARLPVAERFVLSLTTTDACLGVVTPQDELQIAALTAELDAWLDSAQIPAGPVRTCFRLTEPAAPEADPWRGRCPPPAHGRPRRSVAPAHGRAG